MGFRSHELQPTPGPALAVSDGDCKQGTVAFSIKKGAGIYSELPFVDGLFTQVDFWCWISR